MSLGISFKLTGFPKIDMNWITRLVICMVDWLNMGIIAGNVLEGDAEFHIVQSGHQGGYAKRVANLSQWLYIFLSHCCHFTSVEKLEEHSYIEGGIAWEEEHRLLLKIYGAHG